ncbi:alpha-1,6-glucosidase domain-containing protein [Cellvibrio sp. KY-YJ-3]|uniref:alpha-1,6-glucosidase domain-containing protein n=1 Tax=Cellvibrio sp. KY-YJ-3 TaxID=454662 RepID=UPI0017875FA3|nr:alpha-1,6-glucosidase domain-containing protein [Cellvibrio sp. KY-YJ-3]
MKFNSRNESARKALGLAALLLGVFTLSSCGGGGSGTDNNAAELPTCRDPQVLLDNGVCGDPRPPFELPACPEGTIRSGAECVVPDFPVPEKLAGPNEAVIFVNVEGTADEKNAAFAKYNLHLWQSCGNGWADSVTDGSNTTYAIPTTWPNGPGIASKNEGEAGVRHDPYYGAYFVIPVSEAGTCGNFIVKTPNTPNQTADLSLNIKRDGGDYDRMAWVIVNTDNMRNSRVSNVPICINDVCSLERPMLAISDVEAHWISPHTIIWSRSFAAGKSVELYRSAAGGMTGDDAGAVVGGERFAVLGAGRAMTDEEKALVPHMSDYIAYDLPAEISLDSIKSALKDELLVVGRFDSVEEGENEQTVTIERGRGTRVQVPHVLDALYADNAADATLGVSYANGVTASVWAPTAQNVELRVFSGDPLRVSATMPMTFNAETGVWSVTGTATELDRKFYRYRVTAYHPLQKAVRRLEVTDPYSISLSTNGRHSQFVNLDDADTKPAGWEGHSIPEVVAPENMAIYEAHVRDFSIDDASTSASYRGKYLAFTENSLPVQHLRSLADAGLTHVHLLPSNDSSNMKEDFEGQVNLDSYILELCQRVSNRDAVSVCDGSVPNNSTVRQVLESYDPQTSAARTLIAAIADLDGFNWGYDPQHFNAPEGTYATDPEGFTRIKEMRAMNMALHEMGLRVVMDVVYPHTVSSGIEAANSVFDKVVPGYYYRVNPATAVVETGTGAGPDTATEHRMMGKFVADSVAQWAEHYKVDGFRFDQSGYMPKSVLVDAYEATKAVDPDTYFYAEAWTPGGGTSGDRIAVRATQEALNDTEMGTFNDRIRNPLQQMALVKGDNLDAIRAGLAGNLKDFKLKTKSGAVITASTVGAYGTDPQQAINYVEKHDNETLWDWMHRPGAVPTDMTIANRTRVSSLTLSVPVLSQGVPFIQMGTELLRSKSMSPNSYNAGDWFNKVDFTKQSNNWGVGLPPELRDGITDEYVAGLFANAQTKPEASHIEQASSVFTEFMSIASGSPLFSLQTAEQVMDRVGFHDGGKTQVSGLIVMSIDDGAGIVAGTESTPRADLDSAVDAIVVVINATGMTQSPRVKTAAGFALHQTQQNSVDATVKTASFAADGEDGVFTVPAYTTAVFVKAQAGAQGMGLSATATLGSSVAVPYGDTAVYVRGDISASGWANTTAANRFTYEGEGIYSLLLTVVAGTEVNFKVAEAGWSLPNLGSNEVMEIGDTITLTQGSNDNIRINIPAAGTYRFVLDASASTTAPTLKVENPDVYGATAIYLRGTVTASGWENTNSGNQLVHEGNSVYALSVPMVAGQDYMFKVASADWSTVNLGSATPVMLGEGVVLAQGSNDNLMLDIAEAGNYRFEVDARNPDAPVVKVYREDLFAATPIYLRGTVSAAGWGDANSINQMIYASKGLYTKTLTLAVGSYEFKVAEANWSNPNLGGSAVVLGEPSEVTQGSNDNIGLSITTAGDYRFTLDTTNPNALTIRVDAVN